MKTLFAALGLSLFLGSLQAQTIPIGGSIQNTSGMDLNFQLAIPDSSNPIDPWKELSSGVVKPNDSVSIPNDPSLCGVVLRVVVWDFSVPPNVWGPLYLTITC